MERVPRTGEDAFVTGYLMGPQLLVRGLRRGRGDVLGFTHPLETLGRALFSLRGRVGVGYGGFQSTDHMALIFICGME